VLAVVEHDRRLAVLEGRAESLEQPITTLTRRVARLVEAERPAHRAGDPAGGDGRQLHPPGAVGPLGVERRGELGSQAGLPRAARADERHQAPLPRQVAELAELVLAPEAGRQRPPHAPAGRVG
jgi:hypothetical protein